MKSPLLRVVLTLSLVSSVTASTGLAAENTPAAAAAANAPAVAAAQSPDQVVKAYLTAMQAHQFAAAYQLVSSTLRAGKSEEEWSKEQQYIMQMGEVKIIEFKVYPAIVGADGIARVPNLLKSQDKYLNQLGLDEHELYELIQEGGAWRIDQQTLAEGADRAKFFPDAGTKKE